MIELINILAIPDSDPQRYRLHFKDAEKHRLQKGYQFDSVDGTKAEISKHMKNGGMNDAQIEVWFAQVK